jgi:hypothetical protein
MLGMRGQQRGTMTTSIQKLAKMDGAPREREKTPRKAVIRTIIFCQAEGTVAQRGGKTPV